jgi:hypothetical protein
MKFKVYQASTGYFNLREEIEINTLEDLMRFIEECDEQIIISKDKKIIIYDDYIE